MKLNLEICAGSLLSAIAAQKGGADRLELCDNLSEGGTTPSYGMIKTCKSLLIIPVFPIIRPRGGNFVYTDGEFQVMKQDVACCSKLGCDGVVIGMLGKDRTVDTERCAELISLAGNMQITFHRAFDSCRDLEKGLEDIIGLGCGRVLTSGGKMYAQEGIDNLRKLVDQAANRIIVMPGSGITEHNLLKIAKGTGAFEFHSTAKKVTASDAKKFTGHGADISYFYETDAENVAKMRLLLQDFVH